MGPRMTPKATKQLSATSQDYVVKLTTSWLLAAGSGTNGVLLLDEIEAIANNYRHKAALRTASVLTDLPSAWTFSTNVRSANGANPETFTPTSGHIWVQAGLAVSAAAGPPTAGEALASIQAIAKGRAQIVADETILIQPYLNASSTAEYALGAPFAGFGATKLIFGIVATGVSGTVTVQGSYRTVQLPQDAGTFQTVGSSHNFTANEVWNQGEVAITPGNVMWAQAGLTVTATGRGSFCVIVVAIW